jgi:hypothetical protein
MHLVCALIASKLMVVLFSRPRYAVVSETTKVKIRK